MSLPNQVVVQIFEPSTPFGGVQFNLDQQPTVQLALDSGSPVQSVFGRVGDIQAQCGDYASCYAPLGSGLPSGGLTGQTLTKLSDASLDVGWSNAGAGTVTNFSAGGLSPLFASNVANPSSTPALTFSLSNAPAHSFLGNNTGAPGAPSYVQPAFSDLSGQFALNQTPNISASVLIGRGSAAGAGIFQEITLGTNLSMSGTTLNATGGGGAPSDAHYLTSQAESGLSAEVNLGLLSTGLLKATIAAGVATMSTITDSSANWDSAFSERRQWDGGSTNLTASTGRTSLGANAVGSNIFTATNPSAISFLKVNADNSIVFESAATHRTSLGVAASGAVGSSGLTMNTARLLGRTTAAVGAIEEITVNAEFSFTATALALATAGVAYAKIQNVAALSVFGRASNSAGVGADISAGADFNVLRRSGTTIGFGPIDLSQAGAVTGDLAFANLAQGSARSVLGVTGNATADFASIQGTADQVLVVNGAGTALAFGTVATNGITNAAVTYAKMQNVAAESVLCRANTVAGTVGEVALAASQLLGRGATGDVAAITLGSGLSMTGATLNVTAGGGNVSNSGTPTVGQGAFWVDATHIQGTSLIALSGGVIKADALSLQLFDTGDPTKLIRFSANSLATGRTVTVIVPDTVDNPIVPLPDGGAANNFLTSLSGTTGLFTKARPTISNLTDLSGIKKLVGSNDASGAVTEIILGTNLSMTGNTLNAAGGSGSPGGSNTQIQYNDNTVFAGTVGVTWNKTTSHLSLSAGVQLDIGGGFLVDPGTSQMNIGYSSALMAMGSFGIKVVSIGFTSSVTSAGADCGIARNGADIVEINNGTVGQFRDLLARGLRSNAVLFANRIAAPVEGTLQAFTDSNTGTQGATIAGGGTNHVMGYYNGTNWIVATGGGAGGGNVTTSATLTSNALILGNGGVDIKISSLISSDGSAKIILGDTASVSGSLQLNTGAANALVLAPPSNPAAPVTFTFPAVTTNLQVTGGANHVLKQTSAGGAVTSGQVAASEVSGLPTFPSGTIVGTTDTQTLSAKRINPRVTDQNAPSTPYTPDSDANDMVILRGIANATQTINAPSGTPVAGQKLVLRLKDNGTSRTLSFQTGAGQYRFSSDMAAPAATTINKTLYMLFMWNATDSFWDNLAQMNNF